VSWVREAWHAIDKVHHQLAPDASFEERKGAIFAAYPFGPRANHPYKVWLKAQKTYLDKYRTHAERKRKPMPRSPLERMIDRGRREGNS